MQGWRGVGTAELDQGWALLHVQPFVPRRETWENVYSQFQAPPQTYAGHILFPSICIWAKLEREEKESFP